jgi:Fur family ferric uptake transcriptional regulator
MITSDGGLALPSVSPGSPTVSHQAVYDVLRALTDAGLVRRIQPSGSVGAATRERYDRANFTI